MDTVTAYATVGAVVLSLVLALKAENDAQRAAAAQVQRDKEAQARLVVVTASSWPIENMDVYETWGWFGNYSPLPITRCLLAFEAHPHRGSGREEPCVVALAWVMRVDPGGTLPGNAIGPPQGGLDGHERLFLEFTDARGLTWRRYQDGPRPVALGDALRVRDLERADSFEQFQLLPAPAGAGL